MIDTHHNDFTEKMFRQEDEKCCEASQGTDELLVYPFNFWCILLTSC